MKKFNILFLIYLVLLGVVSNAKADVICVIPPSCNVLGFTQVWEDCNGIVESRIKSCLANGSEDGPLKYLCSCSGISDCERYYQCNTTTGRCFVPEEYKDCAMSGKESDVIISELHDDPNLFNGTSNTQRLCGSLNSSGICANREGVDENAKIIVENALNYKPNVSGTLDEIFATGWYVPTLGEWLEIFGYNYCDTTEENVYDEVLNNDSDIAKINQALRTLISVDNDAAAEINAVYWTSTLTDSEGDEAQAYTFQPRKDGMTKAEIDKKNIKTETAAARYFLLLDNVFCHKQGEEDEENKIQIGDIIFNDRNEGEVELGRCTRNDDQCMGEHMENSSPVGVIVWVSTSGKSAKIMSLVDDAPKILAASKIGTGYSDTQLVNALYVDGKCPNICPMAEQAVPFSYPEVFYNGKSNTEILKEKYKNNSDQEIISYGAANYYIPGFENHKLIGRGKWYVPSLGEWVKLRGFSLSSMYDVIDDVTSESSEVCYDRDERCVRGSAGTPTPSGNIENMLNNLNITGSGDNYSYYWTSTPFNENNAWVFEPYSGGRDYAQKDNSSTFADSIGSRTDIPLSVRYMIYLENIFCDNSDGWGSSVQIGNSVCIDSNGELTYSTVGCGLGTTFVGAVVWKSDQGQSIKLLSDKITSGSNIKWASTLENIDQLENISVYQAGVYLGIQMDKPRTCADVKFETVWEKQASGQTSNEYGCDENNSDLHQKVRFANGSTGDCYSPRCKCAKGQVYAVDGNCYKGYANCKAYDDEHGKEKLYNIPAAARDVACYPTQEEYEVGAAQGNNTDEIIDLDDTSRYPIIALKNGYFDQCFSDDNPSMEHEDRDGLLPACRRVDSSYQIYFGGNDPRIQANNRHCTQIMEIETSAVKCNGEWNKRKIKCCKSYDPVWWQKPQKDATYSSR